MKSLFIMCAAVACTIAATGCTTGDGGPAMGPIDPFGTEPASTGSEPTGDNSDTIAQLCAAACARIQSGCPGAAGGTNCAAECASSAPPGCETQFRAFLRCLAGSQIFCDGTSFDVPQCQSAIDAVSICINSTGVPGNGTAGGTGAAGAAGTR